MYNLSDEIEKFLRELIESNTGLVIQIQRNELACQFNCSPSQINYVLSTRFSQDKGYYIESKRGGRGYIVIQKVKTSNYDDLKEKLFQYIGDQITYTKAVGLINLLINDLVIDENEALIIKACINDRNFVKIEKRNEIRADILKSIICVIINRRD